MDAGVAARLFDGFCSSQAPVGCIRLLKKTDDANAVLSQSTASKVHTHEHTFNLLFLIV